MLFSKVMKYPMSNSGKYILISVVILVTHIVANVGIAGDRYTGPMIDAHGHLGESFDWDTIVSVMDQNNITRQIVMARYYDGPANIADLAGNDELAMDLVNQYPGRFFPLVGMQRPELLGSKKWRNLNVAIESLLKNTEAKLASGHFRGIGEVIVKHFAYSTWKHAEQENPIYSTFMQRLSELATRYDVPVVIHMEGAPRHVKGLSRLLRENPRARFVWAHNCGRSKAPVIRSMLKNHTNLFCDIASMTNVGKRGYGIGWPRMEDYNALIEENGVLFPQMRDLYEAFPDRFMIGMDVAHAQGMNPVNYGRRSKRFRVILNQLTPQTAAAIAEGNAIRVYKLDQ